MLRQVLISNAAICKEHWLLNTVSIEFFISRRATLGSDITVRTSIHLCSSPAHGVYYPWNRSIWFVWLYPIDTFITHSNPPNILEYIVCKRSEALTHANQTNISSEKNQHLVLELWNKVASHSQCEQDRFFVHTFIDVESFRRECDIKELAIEMSEGSSYLRLPWQIVRTTEFAFNTNKYVVELCSIDLALRWWQSAHIALLFARIVLFCCYQAFPSPLLMLIDCVLMLTQWCSVFWLRWDIAVRMNSHK